MTEKPVTVRRVEDATGTHIEPPLDHTWDEDTKLRWQAAVVAHDTGLAIQVHPHTYPARRTEYGATIGELSKGGQTSLSLGPYRDAWNALTFISIGAQAVRQAIAHEESP